MEIVLVMVFFISIISVMFMSFSVLSLLISLEFLILIVFMGMMLLLYSDSVLELIIFMVLSTGESVLGLVVMLMKVGFEGSDFFSEMDI